MSVLLCLLLLLAIYPYGLYPPLAVLLARLRPTPWRQEAIEPQVSLIVSVYNEERVIAEKLQNALALDYPAELLEILVVSDGSTDRTLEIASGIGDPRIVLQDFPERAGKTACLNRVVPQARGEIVVFTDANAMFPPATLRLLTRHFADPQVGLVSGWTKYRNAAGDEESAGLYARLERLTKAAESRVASCVGADGAVFAMRRELYTGLLESDINDFVLPLQVIGRGRRVLLDEGAFCLEEPTEAPAREFRRQIRITARTLAALARNRRYFNPLAYGWFAFFLLSHKLLRFLVPFFFLATLTAALPLAAASPLFAGVVVAQLLFLTVGAAALVFGFGGRAGRLCSFFLLTMAAQLIGWLRWARGRTDVVWTPQR